MELELDLEELKAEAQDLGISYSANIGAKKLKEKIDAYYESQETSGKEILEAAAAYDAGMEKSEEKSVKIDKPSNGKRSLEEIAKTIRKSPAQMKAEANKTRVVTVIDNDQRVNNQTTTARVNCTNMFFDLGTVIVPLNVPVELKMGHINSLKEVRIPQHSKDPKTGLSTAKVIPRYTISYEDMK